MCLAAKENPGCCCAFGPWIYHLEQGLHHSLCSVIAIFLRSRDWLFCRMLPRKHKLRCGSKGFVRNIKTPYHSYHLGISKGFRSSVPEIKTKCIFLIINHNSTGEDWKWMVEGSEGWCMYQIIHQRLESRGGQKEINRPGNHRKALDFPQVIEVGQGC